MSFSDIAASLKCDYSANNHEAMYMEAVNMIREHMGDSVTKDIISQEKDPHEPDDLVYLGEYDIYDESPLEEGKVSAVYARIDLTEKPSRILKKLKGLAITPNEIVRSKNHISVEWEFSQPIIANSHMEETLVSQSFANLLFDVKVQSFAIIMY